MKRSESDGTDLKITKKLLNSMLLIFAFLTPAMAAELHLFSSQESTVMNGVLIIGETSYPISSHIENELLEGVLLEQATDSVNDGTGGLDSVNDGTGGLDSVNDGTGGLDSVNDGTGGLDSVNDGTGGLSNFENAVLSIDFLNCQKLTVETSLEIHEIILSKINIDNEEFTCN